MSSRPSGLRPGCALVLHRRLEVADPLSQPLGHLRIFFPPNNSTATPRITINSGIPIIRAIVHLPT